MEAPTLLPLPVLDAALRPLLAPAGPCVVPSLPPTVLAAGPKRRLANWLLAFVELKMLLRFLRSPAKIRQALGQLRQLRTHYFGQMVPHKVACVAGRYYQRYHTPGWPSGAYATYAATFINRLVPFRAPAPALDAVFLAITKKCPLACAHCYEWDALNQAEKLTLPDLHALVASFQQKNVSQIFFSGGEPLLRLHDLLQVLPAARPGTDFWVLTSGFNLTRENAHKLRQAGLTGVSISLDHYLPAQHNAFRGSATAFANALQAVVHAQAAGLVVNLSVCVTREFTTAANLLRYAQLARRLGAAFVQLVEPRAVGHFAGQEVALSSTQLEVLDAFYETLNFNPAYHDWPIITYYGYHQRRLGCSGAANKFLYVDTDGEVHACPFCQKKSGSALAGSLDASMAAVRAAGCQQFKPCVV